MHELFLVVLVNVLVSSGYANTSTMALPSDVLLIEGKKPTDGDLEGDNFYFIENKDVIKRKELQTRNADHVSEYLQNIPGVSVVGGSTPQFKTITIRGMDGYRVVQQVDGARRYERTQGTLSSDIGIEAESLKRVEVEKGAESLTSSAGAIGGAVLYKTIDPSDLLVGGKEQAAEAKVSYSSATSSTAQSVTAASKIDKNTGALLQAIWRNIRRTESGGDNSQKTDLDFKRQSFMAKLENQSAIGTINIKGSYASTENDNTSYRAGEDDSTSDYTDRTTEATINHRYVSKNNPLLNLSNNFYVNKRVSEKDTHTAWRGFESTVGKTRDVVSQHGGKISNRALISLSERNYFESELGLSYSATEMEEFDGSDISFYGKSSGSDQGIFTMNNLSFANDTIIFKAGARVNRYERESDQLAIDTRSTDGSTFSNVIGVTVKPLSFVDVFAKLSNSNRAPEVRELYFGGGRPFACHSPRKICNNTPNPNLKEEFAYAREVGVNLHNKDNGVVRTNLKVSYFHEKIDDYIEAVPFMYRIVNGEEVQAGPRDATHRDYKSMNLNRVIRSGVETQLNFGVYGFDFGAKYSSMNIDCLHCPVMFDASTVREPLFTAPADKLVLTAGYNFREFDFDIGYRGEFVDSQKRLSERYKRAGYATPGYSVHSAFMGWEPTYRYTGKFRLDFGVDNFTNKEYKVHNSGSGAFELGQNYRMSLTKFF